MNEEKWIEWEMHTSKKWSDLEDVLKPINISFIDYDHKRLVEYALELNKCMDKLDIDFSIELLNDIKEVIDSLYKYAIFHFEREEVFMSKYNLPEIEKHKKEHSSILLMLKNELENFENGRIKVGQKLKFQVTDWLINHINYIDYNFFNIENWSKNLIHASDWNEVKNIINLTGISDIDEQHRIFTTMAIEIMENISKNNNEEFIKNEFKRFKEYALFHFQYEQKFMSKYDVKETYDHHELHEYFIKELDAFPDQIIKDNSRINELKAWILKWWINHINTIDRNTFKYKNWAYTLLDKARTIKDVEFLLRRIGISDIDKDHIHLMEVTLNLNKIVEDYIEHVRDMDTKKAQMEIGLILDEICKVAHEHFAREEKIMKLNNLEDTKSHIDEHRKIIQKFNSIRDNYISGRLKVSKNIKRTILEWWIEHTNTIDYVTFVRHFKNEDGFTKKGGSILGSSHDYEYKD